MTLEERFEAVKPALMAYSKAEFNDSTEPGFESIIELVYTSSPDFKMDEIIVELNLETLTIDSFINGVIVSEIPVNEGELNSITFEWSELVAPAFDKLDM